MPAKAPRGPSVTLRRSSSLPTQQKTTSAPRAAPPRRWVALADARGLPDTLDPARWWLLRGWSRAGVSAPRETLPDPAVGPYASGRRPSQPAPPPLPPSRLASARGGAVSLASKAQRVTCVRAQPSLRNRGRCSSGLNRPAAARTVRTMPVSMRCRVYSKASLASGVESVSCA